MLDEDDAQDLLGIVSAQGRARGDGGDDPNWQPDYDSDGDGAPYHDAASGSGSEEGGSSGSEGGGGRRRRTRRRRWVVVVVVVGV